MKLIVGVISMLLFRQKRNFISSYKCYVNTNQNEILRKETSARAYISSKQR